MTPRHGTKWSWVLGLSLLLLSASAASDGDGWFAFAPEGGRFRVALPSFPHIGDVGGGGIGDCSGPTFVSVEGEREFSASYCDVPRVALWFMSPAKILAASCRGILSENEATEVSSDTAPRDGNDSRTLVFQSTDGRVLPWGRAEALMVGTRIFVFVANGQSQEAVEENRFFESIELSAKVGAQARGGPES